MHIHAEKVLHSMAVIKDSQYHLCPTFGNSLAAPEFLKNKK